MHSPIIIIPSRVLTPLSRKSSKQKHKFTATKELQTFCHQQYNINVSNATNTELLSLVALIEDKSITPIRRN